jgi:hypothetical protein
MTQEVNSKDMRKFLVGILTETPGKATVVFTKSDGTERELLCTLKEEFIGAYEKKTERVKKENPDVMSVWDLENNGWRSFRIDSVKRIDFDVVGHA